MNVEKYVKNRLKPPKSFFEWCVSQLPVYKFGAGDKAVYSSNHIKNRKVINRRKSERNKSISSKFYPFGIILVSPKRIEIQSYGYWLGVFDYQETIGYQLTNLEVFTNDQHIKVGEWNGNYIEGLSPNFSWMGGPYERTVFYENDWESKLIKSELKYIAVEHVCRYEIKRLYKFRREIEFCQKIRANQLAHNIRYGLADMRVVTEKWLRKNKPLLKNSDYSYDEFEFERKVKARGGKVVPGIRKYLGLKDLSKVPKNIGIVKFQNWIIKNEVRFDYYVDYLNLMKELKIPLDIESLIIPSDITKAHDEAVELLNMVKEQERQAAEKEKMKLFEKRVKSTIKLEKKIDNYVFIVPKDYTDIIREGKELHHCVGSNAYIERHAKGTTTIVFLRDESDVHKPLYTIEYKDKRIFQIQGNQNQSPPSEVLEVAHKWEEWASRTKKRKEIQRTKISS